MTSKAVFFDQPPLQKSFKDARNKNPDLKPLLNFFETIYVLQSQSVQQIKPQFKLKGAQERLAQGKPAFPLEKLDIKLTTSSNLLIEMAQAVSKPSESRLSEVISSTPKIHLKKCLEALIKNDDVLVKKLAQKNGLNENSLALIFKLALSTLYIGACLKTVSQLDLASWNKGFCPLCGHQPFISKLRLEDGSRMLKCSFCYFEWRFPRLTCPFCGKTEEREFYYLFAEDDRAHRIDLCDNCQRYLKTLDERSLKKEVNLLAEDILLIGLETAAIQEGYHPWSSKS